MMKRGFTILELLVASLLLGILMTILTMIFNQSSIAWRTGTASVAKLDNVRNDISAVRAEADDAWFWQDRAMSIVSPWNYRQGGLNTRTVDVNGSLSGITRRLPTSLGGSSVYQHTISVGSGQSSKDFKSYTVNVKSAGPNGTFNDYDDIWSYPDDPEEWCN